MRSFVGRYVYHRRYPSPSRLHESDESLRPAARLVSLPEVIELAVERDAVALGQLAAGPAQLLACVCVPEEYVRTGVHDRVHRRPVAACVRLLALVFGPAVVTWIVLIEREEWMRRRILSVAGIPASDSCLHLNSHACVEETREILDTRSAVGVIRVILECRPLILRCLTALEQSRAIIGRRIAMKSLISVDICLPLLRSR